jgi:release factor glutamine methyltransferase
MTKNQNEFFGLPKRGVRRFHPPFLDASTGFSAFRGQVARLQERRNTELVRVRIRGLKLDVFQGVYDTGVDTELMIDAVDIQRRDNFLEIGSGTGAVSICLAQRGRYGVGVDINPVAVSNSQHNAALLNVSNLTFFQTDVFERVRGRFDVIVCNPPYSSHPIRDVIERMFWDPGNDMKRRFFDQVRSHLAPNGRIYFGWADFCDIDRSLPIKLARQRGFTLVNTHERVSRSGAYRFFVLEFHNQYPRHDN